MTNHATEAGGARDAALDEGSLAYAGEEGEGDARDERDDSVVQQRARAVPGGGVGRGRLLAGRNGGVQRLGNVGRTM